MDDGIDWYYLENLPYHSPRRFEIIRLVSQGYNHDEVAKKLYISHGTVKNQMGRVYQRVGARNRAHLISLAHQAGIL